MTDQEFIHLLQDDAGKLIPRRCTQQYLQNNNLLGVLDQLTPSSFGSVAQRIKLLKYGGGYCEVCGTRTKIDITGRGFAKYCCQHFHHAKKGKISHNNKQVDIDLIRDLYVNHEQSILEISRQIGNISNVTLKKKMIEAGIELRSHSHNQKLHCKTGATGPKITIDRQQLVFEYKTNKVPIGILATKYNCSEETIRRFLIQEGVERTNRRSTIEWTIIDILDRLGIKYRTNVKNVIYPLEIDIFIEQHNLAIEVNGLYTHSLYRGEKNKQYHYNKYMLCKDKNIQLVQLWEDDIRNKPEIIESMLAYRCNMSNKAIDARKCDVRLIDYKIAAQFYEDNHIQGKPAKNTKSIALYYKDILVACLGYLSNDTHTTIIRYCSLLNHNIRGGFTKLLARLSRPIITYSSNDISWGKLYSSNGFEQIASTKYDLWYTDYTKVYNRQVFMKQKLPTNKLISIFDSQKTEAENMVANGFDLIYKSGTVTWKLY